MSRHPHVPDEEGLLWQEDQLEAHCRRSRQILWHCKHTGLARRGRRLPKSAESLLSFGARALHFSPARCGEEPIAIVDLHRAFHNFGITDHMHGILSDLILLLIFQSAYISIFDIHAYLA